MTDPTPDTPRGWKHRRIGFYVSLTALLVIGSRLAFGPEVPEGNREPLITLLWVFGLVVVAFYGNNAWEAVARIKR